MSKKFKFKKMKKKLNVIGLIMVMLAFFITSCTNPPSAESLKVIDMDSLKVKIQAMEDTYAAGMKAKDAFAIVEYYSDDAISYHPNREPLVGKEAIKNHCTESFAKDTTNTSGVFKVVDLFTDGDMIVEIGSWQEFDSNGKEVNHGHYMSYFQNRNGKYVCVRDMNVSSMPFDKP
ncbi:hypothetical protein ES708_22140 [subsurface metagenome]